MFSIKKIDIKRDEGSVMAMVEHNLEMAMATMKSEKPDSFCPSIAKVGIFMEGS
ncbi:hypothetical protein [Methanobacterium sp.]|uniref:hypothetical protein n=1 Tax=Methanobacterium sp. TaxID=2164 RepID=UPI002AB88962|nr:hypothetical protein [Methanobacterium sp.]MDY9922748.1 hypothetical protein [Methanobacterium sp.]